MHVSIVHPKLCFSPTMKPSCGDRLGVDAAAHWGCRPHTGTRLSTSGLAQNTALKRFKHAVPSVIRVGNDNGTVIHKFFDFRIPLNMTLLHPLTEGFKEKPFLIPFKMRLKGMFRKFESILVTGCESASCVPFLSPPLSTVAV